MGEDLERRADRSQSRRVGRVAVNDGRNLGSSSIDLGVKHRFSVHIGTVERTRRVDVKLDHIVGTDLVEHHASALDPSAR